MRWLAALATGVACALGAAAALGRMPALRWGARRPRRRWGRPGLGDAALPVSRRQFWLVTAGIAGGAFVVVTALTGAPLVALVPAAGLAALPAAYYSRQRQQRLRVVQAAWPDGLRDLRASIAAGRSLSQALLDLERNGPEPLREAFARFPSMVRVAGPVAALESIKAELADPTTDRVVEVLIIGIERGGPVVQELLDDLTVATTRDLKALDEIDTEGLEARINARAVLVLPWFVLVALTIREGPFRDFYRSGGGLAVIVVGGVLSVVGAALVGRLARSEPELRVFAPVEGRP